MCLTKIDSFPRITLFPKKVYKLLCRQFVVKTHEYQYVTPYTFMSIELGKTYKGEFLNTTFYDSLFDDTIKDGYIHCFKDIKSARESPIFGTLIECIIPAGTLYWRGVGGEISTRKLKYIREL